MSECGLQPCASSIPTSLTVADVDDRRVMSIGAATDWAKMNNLLGVFLRSDLLVSLVFVTPRVIVLDAPICRRKCRR